jgi:uncharacterized MAPEG superfamily protein
MDASLRYLALTLVLALVQIFWAAGERTRKTGLVWNMGPRDDAPQPSLRAARLQRAQANLYETLPLFAAAVIVARIADREGFMTTLGAGLYFWGRLVYVPLYAFGVPAVRSLAWGVALLGLVLVLAALLVGR